MRIGRLVGALLATLLAPGVALAEDPPPNGVFLVAKRHLLDPNFHEAVVLVTQHASGSPVGVIVNRPTKVPLSRIFPDNDRLKDAPDTVFFGGPVSPQLLVYVFRAQSHPKDALRMLEDVYLSFDAELLVELLGRVKPTVELRVYAGYSGWGPGQLQEEIARGDWHLVRADAEMIFGKDPARVWEEMLKRATAKQVHAPAPALSAGR